LTEDRHGHDSRVRLFRGDKALPGEALNLAKKGEVYKCSICGNVVEVLQGGKGQLVCCGKPMELLDEKGARAYRTRK
jgi:desulfoferrodoxin-like iron-binding protein